MWIKVTEILLVFTFIIATVNCLKCFQCRSDKDTKCNELVSDKYLKECEELHDYMDIAKPATVLEVVTNSTFVCRKIIQNLRIAKSTTYTFIRECAVQTIGNKCERISNRLLFVEVCDCDEEGCNKLRIPDSTFVFIALAGLFVTLTLLFYILVVQGSYRRITINAKQLRLDTITI